MDVISGYRLTTLSNGMRILISGNAPGHWFAYALAYPVGSADSPPGQSGIAHMVEHLMFRGAPGYVDGSIDRLMTEAGVNYNAWTSQDLTLYHGKGHLDAFDLVMDIEAARMSGIEVDPDGFAAERDVVATERVQHIDSNPTELAWAQASARLFPNHPYGIAIIGNSDDIRSYSLENCLKFHREFYGPSSAVLAVAGSMDPDRALDVIAAKFDSLPPRGRGPLPLDPPDDVDAGVVQVTDRRAEERMALIAMRPHAGCRCDDLTLAISLFARAFAGGRTSWLWRRLVDDEGAAISTFTGYEPSARVPPGLFIGALCSADDHALHVAERIRDHLRSFIAHPEPEYLRHALEVRKSGHAFRISEPHHVCSLMAQAHALHIEAVRMVEAVKVLERMDLEQTLNMAISALDPDNIVVAAADRVPPESHA